MTRLHNMSKLPDKAGRFLGSLEISTGYDHNCTALGKLSSCLPAHKEDLYARLSTLLLILWGQSRVAELRGRPSK